MSKKKSKASRRGPIRIVLFLLLLLIALGVFFAAFQLKTVYVRGNLHNTPDEVTDILRKKPIMGNTILAKLFNTNRKIEDPGFIDSVNVEILSREAVRAVVTERTFVGCVGAGASLWYFDASGKVMATAQELTPGEYVPRVYGLVPDRDPELGSYLMVSNTKVFSMLAMLKARIDVSPELMPDRVDFDSSGTMKLTIGSVEVLLGDGEKLELRLRQLAGVMPELLSGGYSGTLHLENYDGSQTGLIFDKRE